MRNRPALLLIVVLLLTLPLSVQAQAGDCDGTPGDDVINCTVTPVNPNFSIDADLGNDHITIGPNVIIPYVENYPNSNVRGDGSPEGGHPEGINGGDDTIINYGQLGQGYSVLVGDDVSNDGGNDTITNYGSAGIMGDHATYNGGDDILSNYGLSLEGIVGDVAAVGHGGNDQILNAVNATTTYILGDFVYLGDGSGGDDEIVNNGRVLRPVEATWSYGSIFGDSTLTGSGGEDRISNTGTVDGNIYGDGIQLYPDVGEPGTGGADFIHNTGSVQNSIYGDYIFSLNQGNTYIYEAELSNTNGGNDTIINSGTIGGAIYAEGGDDTVRLGWGANGGADRLLVIDGGAGDDTLVFELRPEAVITNRTGTPASGSITVNGYTFQWLNFEAVFDTIPPAVTAPNGTITTPYGNPIYTWTDTDDEVYELAVWLVQADNPTFQPGTLWYYGQNLTDDTVCNGTTCSLDATTVYEPGRLTNGQYQAWVRVADGTWNGPFPFRLNAPPPAPVENLAVVNPNADPLTATWTLSGAATSATYIRLYLIPKAQFDAGQYTPLVDGWFRRDLLCGGANGTTCSAELSLSGPVALDDGQYYLFSQSFGPGGYSVGGAQFNNGWAGLAFTRDRWPSPVVPTNLTVTPNQGRPTIEWANDPNATRYYVAVYNWTANVWAYGAYHSSFLPDPALTCGGGTCTLNADAMILGNGSYSVFVNAEGYGEVSQGGPHGNGFAGPVNPVDTTEPGDFVLNFAPPELVPGIIRTYNNGSLTVIFQSVAGATWYNLWVGTANAATTQHYQWYSSNQLGCPNGLGQTCMVMIPLNLPAGTYYVAVQSAGPGGYSSGGEFNNGFRVNVDGLVVP
ncbi:MAG: calcium-binding protein [bacterium]|nr:calcium-binding protein [bacterium]